MRAHLLQTTYNNDQSDDAQLDCAVNDANFVASSPTKKSAENAAAPAPIAAPVTSPIAAGSNSDNDDYYLGGYAGI